MEGIQFFSYALTGTLIVMALVFQLLPMPAIKDLEKYSVSKKFMSFSYLSLGFYCIARPTLPVDLVGTPFLFISIFQTHLLAISFINMMNADYVKLPYVMSMLSPSIVLLVVEIVCIILTGYHPISSYQELFNLAFMQLEPEVLVRIGTLGYYLALIGYYIYSFVKERAAQQARLQKLTIDVEFHQHALSRLYQGNSIGLSVCAITLIVLFTTSQAMRSNCTLAIMTLYIVIGFFVISYPKIYLTASDAVKDEEEEDNSHSAEEKAAIWAAWRARIVKEGLFKQPGVTVSRLAECFDVSRGLFSNVINQCEGVNFNTFIKNLRIESAQDIMKSNPAISLVEVMTAIGYSDQANFSRHFKQVVGIPPAEWKKCNCLQADQSK